VKVPAPATARVSEMVIVSPAANVETVLVAGPPPLELKEKPELSVLHPVEAQAGVANPRSKAAIAAPNAVFMRRALSQSFSGWHQRPWRV